jgi:glutamate/tyrosine decarboxylase-like PLP-dependent enzyme
MADRSALLTRTLSHARAYFDALPTRPVRASMPSAEIRTALGGPMPMSGRDPERLIDELARVGLTGTVATQGPRYFGFVVGGSLPVALAADWLVSTWDQNSAVHALSPVGAVVEDIAGGWMRSIAGVADSWTVGFTTGCQMANFTALAAARHHVLGTAGWDVEAHGLIGAPPVEVVTSDESHYTIFNALRFLGFGEARVRRVPTDAQGRMKADALAGLLRGGTGPCIVCAQAGNVNTGAFDPVEALADATSARGAWLHVDAAFGFWARIHPQLSALTAGWSRADSIATDGHKWLNVPYDSGVVLCAHPDAHRRAMTLPAAYIVETPVERDSREFVPEESRRLRGLPVYAALATLGIEGLRELVDRCHRLALRMADRLARAPHLTVLNDVVLNQVLVRVGHGKERADAVTRDTIARIQQEGTCWLGGTTWHDMAAIRISIANWSTTEADIDASADAIARAAAEAVAATASSG